MVRSPVILPGAILGVLVAPCSTGYWAALAGRRPAVPRSVRAVSGGLALGCAGAVLGGLVALYVGREESIGTMRR